jgi:PAS domain S-box-containing protein
MANAPTAKQNSGSTSMTKNDTAARDIFADLEATLDQVAEDNPRIQSTGEPAKTTADLKALLEATLATTSSLVLDDVLELVMRKAIELMQAERGLVMLLDEAGHLQVKTAYNLCQEEMQDDDFRISTSIASDVARSGKSVYTSDAQQDERFAHQESVVELHLRSIMCVPLKVAGRIIGVIYVDNSSQAKMFLKSDLYLFELYAQMVAIALHNAGLYESMRNLKLYNESIVNKSPIGIIVVDDAKRILTINTAALEIFDLNLQSLRLNGPDEERSLFVDLIPEFERGRWEHMIETARTTQQEFSDSRYFHNTGYVEKALSIKISPLPELPNGDDGLVMTVEDITEKVIMEKYVILSEKLVAKGEMAASIAHELNNYLAIASNNAELLAINIEKAKFEKAKFNSKTIVDNIFKIKRFVDNLMDFSRPESEFINYDLRHLVEDLLFSLRVQPRFKRTMFTINLPNNLPTVEMDVGQIQQVLMNLLNNAADAIEERAINSEQNNPDFKRQISITASYDEDAERVNVEVSDNGTGMSKETLDKIFTIHFTTKKGGHGLGLTNCRKIMEQHHGELQVESSEGLGSVFRLLIPRFQPRKKTAAKVK